MKLQLRLLALVLSAFMVLAYAAPEKAPQEGRPAAEASEDPISKYASPGEDAVGDVLLQAMSLLGVAYRFGGNSPDNGLDCSGFVRYVFQKSLRVNLPRTAAEMAHVGKAVARSELAPGDIVFFNTRGFAYSHVGLYMGNGKFIHSPRTGKNVEVANMNQSYWVSRFNGARRVNRTTAALASAAPATAPVAGLAEKRPAAAQVKAVIPAGKPAADAVVVKCRKGRKCKQPAVVEAVAAAPAVKCRKGRKCKAVAAETAAAAEPTAAKCRKGRKCKAAADSPAPESTTADKPGKKTRAKHGQPAAHSSSKKKKAAH